jgi:putative SOS response-associated peptidase YedK
MCGRYSITLPPEAIRELFRTHGELPNWPAWYNAAPTTALPVVRQAKDSGNRELVLMQWGLVPWFSKAANRHSPRSTPALKACAAAHR